MFVADQDYFILDFKRLWIFICSPSQWLIAAIISVWAYIAFTIFQSSYIQYSPDSFLYKALSQQPLTLNFLVHGDRSPTVPVLLKLFKSEDAFVYFQLFFFYASWLALFTVLKDVIRTYLVYVTLLCVLASLSVAQVFFSWHKLILTESISISGAVLLLALLCRFMTAKTISGQTIVGMAIAWITWQFTRDANAYFSLLIVIGFMAICTIARSGERANVKWKKGQILSIIIFLFALLQLFSINSSQRWQFPLVDVIGLRILPDEERTREFVALGMPMNDKVACFRGKNAVDCNKDWSGFGEWFASGKAKADYQHWLLTHFSGSVKELFVKWKDIWTTETILYGHSLESPLSVHATKIALPKGVDFLGFIVCSFLAAVLALCVAMSAGFRHWLSVLLLFYLVNIPIAFIAYHGDALDVDRHTLNVQLNTYLTGWILILWSIGFIIETITSTLCACFKFLCRVCKP